MGKDNVLPRADFLSIQLYEGSALGEPRLASQSPQVSEDDSELLILQALPPKCQDLQYCRLNAIFLSCWNSLSLVALARQLTCMIMTPHTQPSQQGEDMACLLLFCFLLDHEHKSDGVKIQLCSLDSFPSPPPHQPQVNQEVLHKAGQGLSRYYFPIPSPTPLPSPSLLFPTPHGTLMSCSMS